MNYNFKVVAQLRDDLTQEEREKAVHRIDFLKQKLRLIQLDTGEFVKGSPNEVYEDLGSVYLFYCGLADNKHWFSKLIYHNFYQDVTCQAV